MKVDPRGSTLQSVGLSASFYSFTLSSELNVRMKGHSLLYVQLFVLIYFFLGSSGCLTWSGLLEITRKVSIQKRTVHS